MLRYSVRIDSNMTDFGSLEWGEGVVSQDLSYATGVVPTKYNIGKSSVINATEKVTNKSSQLSVTASRVTRDGYVVAYGKRYNVYSGVSINYGSPLEMAADGVQSYWYVIDGDRYIYLVPDDGTDMAYPVLEPTGHGWLVDDGFGNIEILPIPAGYPDYPWMYYENDVLSANPYVVIDMAYWVEDGMVSIDGVEYEVDFEAASGYGKRGYLVRTTDGGVADPNTDIGCSDVSVIKLSEPYDVDKVMLTKIDDDDRAIDNIKPFSYHMFVSVNGTYANVYESKELDEEDNEILYLKCDVPTRLISVEGASEASGDVLTCTVVTESAGIEFPFYTSGYEVGRKVDEARPFVRIDNQRVYVQYDVSRNLDGDMGMITLSNEIYNVNEGDIVVVRDGEGTCSLQVYDMKDYGGLSFDDYQEEFIIFRGKKYCLTKNLFDKVVIGEDEFTIVGRYDNKVVVLINGENVPMELVDVSGTTMARRYGEAVVSSADTKVEDYEIRSADGVVVNGVGYEVMVRDGQYRYVVLDMGDEYRFRVMEKIGSSVLLCRAGFADGDFTDEFTRYYMSNLIYGMSQGGEYTLYRPNDVFGYYPIASDTVFKYTDSPMTSDSNDIVSNLLLFEDKSYITLTLPLGTTVASNINQDDIIENGVYGTDKLINGIVDMEKDVYVPKYLDGNKYKGSESNFNPIYEINFNLHFRTRDMSNWKVLDGYNNFEVSGITDNWFATDYEPYKSDLENGKGNLIMSASDLLGFVGFTNNDVFMKKDKLSKSFLRLLFYDSTNENTQSLMCMSTVYLDTDRLNKTYIDYKKKPDNRFVQAGLTTGETNNRLTVFSESVDENGYVDYSFKDRLSSAFRAVNKYESDNTAEGYYLYIFKEYSELLYPKPLYLKVEFNHAGIGKTIPMIVPMKWTNSEEDNTKNPSQRLELSNEDDLSDLKKGVPMALARSQMYIPVYCVYDYKNKEYVYCFDSRYAVLDKENGKVSLDLFEIKVMDESTATYGMDGRTAKINIEDAFIV